MSFSPPPSATAAVDTASTAASSATTESTTTGSSWMPKMPTFNSTTTKSTDTAVAATDSSTNISDSYDKRDFSGYTSQVYDSDGLNDEKFEREAAWARANPSYLNHLPPRARNCVKTIGNGCFMGACVGGIFGALVGGVGAVQQRNILVFPVATIGGGLSFGFFLGCGMVLRCDEKKWNATQKTMSSFRKQDHISNIRVCNTTGLMARRLTVPGLKPSVMSM